MDPRDTLEERSTGSTKAVAEGTRSKGYVCTASVPLACNFGFIFRDHTLLPLV